MKSLIAAALLTVVGVAPAYATLQLSADINGTPFFCADQTACDLNLTPGILNVGTVTQGGVTIFGTFQTQTIAVGAGDINRLDTTSFNVVNNNATTVPITIAVGGTGFSGPVTSYTASGTTNFSLAQGSDFNLKFYGDTANNQGADTPNDLPGVQLATTGLTSVTQQSQAFSFNNTGAFVDPNLFSMTLWATTDLVGGGTLTNRTQSIVATKVTSVAEPSSLLLLGGMLASTGLLLRRRA